MQVPISELVNAHAALYEPGEYSVDDDTDVESVMFTISIGGVPVTVRTERYDEYRPPLGDGSGDKYRASIEATIGAPPLDWTDNPEHQDSRTISPTESDPDRYVYFALKEAFKAFRHSTTGVSVAYHTDDGGGKLRVEHNGEVAQDSWDNLSMSVPDFRSATDTIEGYQDSHESEYGIIPLSMDIGGEKLYAYHLPGGHQLFMFEEPDSVFDGGLDSPLFEPNVPHYSDSNAGTSSGAATTQFVRAGCFNSEMFFHLIENATADCAYVNDELDDGQPLPDTGNVVNDAGEA